MTVKPRRLKIVLALACALGFGPPALAKDFHDYAIDVRDYVTAPTRWDRTDWLLAGGAVLATGLAYNEDERVRDHFAPRSTTPSGDRNSLRDDVPLVALT